MCKKKGGLNKPIQKRCCRSSASIHSTDKQTIKCLLNPSSKSL